MQIGAELTAFDCSARAVANRRCQVESRRDESLRGRPLCVLQYDPYDTSAAPRGIEDDRTVDPEKIPRATRAIIAVSYEAKALVVACPCARAVCVRVRAGGVRVGGCACLCDAALTRD